MRHSFDAVATGSYVNAMTIHVPIKEAKNRLNELAHRVRDGERVIITLRGQPHVEMVAAPVEPKRKGFNFEALAKWKAERGYPEKMFGPPSDDFDDPLPEDFLITPQPPEFWDVKPK
jgi:antitoxin (DNA-binding transcriptional repressor) of toxin-antitoxin stability system